VLLASLGNTEAIARHIAGELVPLNEWAQRLLAEKQERLSDEALVRIVEITTPAVFMSELVDAYIPFSTDLKEVTWQL
jgi:hypothetical protein